MKYVSPWLTHFVGHNHPGDNEECYKILSIILKGKKLGQRNVSMILRHL